MCLLIYACSCQSMEVGGNVQKFRGLSLLGCQVWLQAPLPAEPSHRPKRMISFRKRNSFLFLVCVWEALGQVWVFAHGCSALRGQKRILDPLNLELQGGLSHSTLVMGTKLGPSERIGSASAVLSHLSSPERRFLLCSVCVRVSCCLELLILEPLTLKCWDYRCVHCTRLSQTDLKHSYLWGLARCSSYHA